MKIFGAVTVFACLALAGCAGIDVGPVADDSKDTGYRYYDQAPYLFVHSDGKGGLVSEIDMVNTPRKFSLRPYAYLASNNATLSFTNGALNEASVVADETVVPVALADALGKVAGTALAADQPAGSTATFNVPLPHLFRIVVAKDSTINLIEVTTENADGSIAVIKTNIVAPQGK